MYRILIAGCEQEISSFNPVPSGESAFDIHVGQDLLAANCDSETCIRGAVDVLGARPDVALVPVYAAKGCSAGLLARGAFERIAGECLRLLRAQADGADALYLSLHGAMAAEGELDPEGFLLEQARRILGPEVPIVASLDLHGIVTARMLRNLDAAAVYHTYPHEDFADTGARAARLLLRILEEGAHEAGVGARLTLPIGGSLDPKRFPPLTLDIQVALLGDGRYRHEVSGLPADAGPTAVLIAGNITLVVVSTAVHMMDRSIFLAHGRDPQAYDLIVVKSPGAFARYFTFAERNYVVDVPGATTANLKLLGHTVCARPIFPLDDATFEPAVEIYSSRQGPADAVP